MFKIARIVEGHGRELQDRTEVIELPDGLVIALADGAGGMSGGSRAADFVISQVRQRAETVMDLRDEFQWLQCLMEIDSALAEDLVAGETTAVVMSLTPEGIVGASVGDSEAWTITPEAHTVLTRRQRRKPLLGSGEAMPMPFTAPALEGMLLMASDGLFNYAPMESLLRIAQEADMEAAAHQLVELVRLPSGALWDDIAIILCRPLALPGRESV